MKIIPINNLEMDVCYEKLDNGLEIYVVKKKNSKNIYATFTTKFGSNINEFVPAYENKMIKVPDGVAHFLEHKMFEQEDDVDPFTFFSERGADANANTNNYKTTYLFSGPNFFEDNINFLLDYVQKPYFTDENVEKEKGIIEQEIKMYLDDLVICMIMIISGKAYINIASIISTILMPTMIMYIILDIQVMSQVAAKLNVPGKELYLSSYIWLICLIIPIIGWIMLIVMLIYLEVWPLVMLYRGEGEKYIS